MGWRKRGFVALLLLFLVPHTYNGVKACPHCGAGTDSGEEESGIHWLTCDAYNQVSQGVRRETEVSKKNSAGQDRAGKVIY